MNKKLLLFVLLLAVALVIFHFQNDGSPKVSLNADSAEISAGGMVLSWGKTAKGWELKRFDADGISFGTPSGEYAVIFSDKECKDTLEDSVVQDDFLGTTFEILENKRKRTTSAVRMNEAGAYAHFLPTELKQDGDALVFSENTPLGKYSARWQLDTKASSRIKISLNFEAAQDGWYSLPTPTTSTITEADLAWGIVPGWYQGGYINKTFHLAYAYAQGLPDKPVICNENTITTMSSIIENKAGLSLAMVPVPGQDRVAYTDKNLQDKIWKVGLSHMNKRGALTPTAYHPILGQDGSFLKKGEKINFEVYLSLQKKDWYAAYKDVIYNIYNLQKSLDFKETKESLTERVINMHKYLTDDETSMWKIVDCDGLKIGAQRYLGRIVGADKTEKDAIKNSDIGAAYMLASITEDPVLKQTRLPFMRNFKVAQQDKRPGFSQGAALGQYYLTIKKDWTEEWDHTYEPIGLVYYTLIDIGNILLFTPEDKELKDLLRTGAERLLAWQKPDGSWEVAYDKSTHKPLYPDLKDFRPTFYGFLVAYRILGDEKYLEAAKKGADWLIENSVNKSAFVGVCGDVRFINDFGTGQIAGALMEMYAISKDEKYLKAAVETAKMYTTSIYTHPIPTDTDRQIKSQATKEMKTVKDWQLSQVGLSFEHGGGMGSATHSGPILLLSHNAMFVKMYEATGDKLFLDMARAGALGRDAFINPQQHVASYYWARFDNGPGPFPHHAWWQVGWIFDYLVAEAEMRSKGTIKFPRGFMTPKVGPHRSLGFAAGDIMGTKTKLVLKKDLVKIDNPNIDYLTAVSTDGKVFFAILMNNQAKAANFSVKLDLSKIGWNLKNQASEKSEIELEAFGLKILRLEESGHSITNFPVKR